MPGRYLIPVWSERKWFCLAWNQTLLWHFHIFSHFSSEERVFRKEQHFLNNGWQKKTKTRKRRRSLPGQSGHCLSCFLWAMLSWGHWLFWEATREVYLTFYPNLLSCDSILFNEWGVLQFWYLMRSWASTPGGGDVSPRFRILGGGPPRNRDFLRKIYEYVLKFSDFSAFPK